MFHSHSFLRQTVKPLSNEELMAKAPSIFATRPYEGMSDRYTFIPTIAVVEQLRREGFQPFAASESRAVSDDKRGFTRHMIRFRDQRMSVPERPQLGSLFPEIVLMNGHDGSSAYRIDAGIFRLVCSNGMIVADSQIGGVRARHSGSLDNIIEATYEVVQEFPRLLNRVDEFSGVKLEREHQEAFAEAAISLRWDEGKAPVTVPQVLQPKRAEDVAPTLWNTLNRAQETILYGGMRGAASRQRVRTVTSVAENARLNKALWMLAERLEAIVAR